MTAGTVQAPVPESRKLRPSTGMNSHVYDALFSVSFSTPQASLWKTSLLAAERVRPYNG